MIPDKKVVANKQDADFAYEAALLKRIRELLPTFQKMLRKKKKFQDIPKEDKIKTMSNFLKDKPNQCFPNQLRKLQGRNSEDFLKLIKDMGHNLLRYRSMTAHPPLPAELDKKNNQSIYNRI